ncbi:MAG: Ig-like domain-containing protein [Acidobacteriota bacterium]
MKQMKRYWFLGVVVIMALLFAGMTFAGPKGKIPGNERQVKAPERVNPLAYKLSKAENLKKMSEVRAKVRDQYPHACSNQNTEGIPLWDYPNWFSGGTYWVGTNGKAVIFNNGLNLSFADATDVSHPTVVDVRWFDWVYKGIFDGDIAYLLESNAVDIWDVSDPSNPTNLNWWWDCAYTGSYVDMAIKGKYAYLAGSNGDFNIMDLDNGAVVPLDASQAQGNYYNQIMLYGNYLLAYDGAGFDVFDVTEPNCPVFIQNAPFGSYDQVIFDSPYIYAFTYSGSAASQLDIYKWLSVTSGAPDAAPVNPAFPPQNPYASLGYSPDDLTYATKDGNYLYISGWYGAYVVDVSNPAAPALYKFFADNWLQDGNGGHQANYGAWIASANGIHILADGAGITSFDLTPTRTGYYIATSYLFGWWPKDSMAVNSDGSMYLAVAEYEGVVVLDQDLNRTGFWELPTYDSYVWSATFSKDDTMAFVCWEDDTSTTGDAGLSGIAILDVSTGVPTLIKNYIVDKVNYDWVPYYAVPVNIGTKKYLLVDEYQWSATGCRLEMIDITDPTAPVSVSFPIPAYVPGDYLEKPSVAQGYVSGKVFAIVPWWSIGIQTVDITDPQAPVAGVLLALPGRNAVEVAVANVTNHWFGFVATLGATPGLAIIDLANPASATDTIVKGYGNDSTYYWQVHVIPGSSPTQVVAGEAWYYTGYGYQQVFDATSPITPLTVGGRYDYATYYGLDYTYGSAISDAGSNNSFIVTYSSYGPTPWYNVPNDYTAPTVTGPGTVSPTPAGNVIKSPVKICVQGVSDDVTITKVRFYAEDPCTGSDYKMGDAVSPTVAGGDTYCIDFDPANWAYGGGVYDFYAVAYDAGYNTRWYYMGTYTILPVPTIEITAPAADPCGLVDTVMIKGTAYTVAGFISRVEVFIDGVSLGLATALDPPGTCPYSITSGSIPAGPGPVTVYWQIPWDTTGVDDGEHVITAEVLVQDTVPVATAWSTFAMSQPLTVIVANNGPELYITNPSAGDVVSGSTVELNVNILRPDSCIKKVEYYLNGTLIETATTAPWSATWDTTGVPLGNHVLVAQATDINDKIGVSPIVNLKIVQYAAMTVTATASPNSGNAPLSAVLTAAVTGGQAPYTYAWDFGDGQTGTGNVTSHTYTTAGTYTATVTVTDNTAATATASVTITVTGPAIENPVITSVSKATNPFRLHVYGSKFKPGCVVKIDGVTVPLTTYKDSTHVVAKKGAALKAMCPKGTPVKITVLNPDGGLSNEFTYTR